jgi:hypothetical protein
MVVVAIDTHTRAHAAGAGEELGQGGWPRTWTICFADEECQHLSSRVF